MGTLSYVSPKLKSLWEPAFTLKAPQFWTEPLVNTASPDGFLCVLP